MDSIPVPLWSIGVLLIVVGPLVVQRLVDLWSGVVERRTEDALSAMTPRSGGTSVDHPHDDPAVTQHDSAAAPEEQAEEQRDRDEH